ncbi:hypothetical protein [Schlegelella aquatica]|uniref:hypothetical protein n=1 Tax=Caldimonas aquatica TaxID=376175 RepID=UPI00375137F4
MDWLPLLNLLLVPCIGLLMGIKSELAAIGAVQREHARRLDRLESARMPLRAVE